MPKMFQNLSNLLSLKKSSDVDSEIVDKIVEEVKEIGRMGLNDDTNESVNQIVRLLGFMRKYRDVLNIQRASCHAISNLAMQVSPARWIVQRGGFQLIKRATERFYYDEKLCWLASSAVWNLARPPANRSLIGAAGVNTMLQVLQNHQYSAKVVNTAVGALSNLSLCDDLKQLISSKNNLELLFTVFQIFVDQKNMSVATSTAGLIANLAVSDEIATELLKRDFLQIVLSVLEWEHINLENDDEVTLYRNICASINNMITGENFAYQLLINNGIEIIYKCLDDISNELLSNLLTNCLIHVQADPQYKTTSLHVAALLNEFDVIKFIINKKPETDLNVKDACDATVLEYAVVKNNTQVVEFLCRCGASTDSLDLQNVSEEITQSIKAGQSALSELKTEYKLASQEALKELPKDICNLFVEPLDVIEMLQATDMF